MTAARSSSSISMSARLPLLPGNDRVTTDASTAASRRCSVVSPRLPCCSRYRAEPMRGAASSRSRKDAASTRSRSSPSRRSAVVTRPRAARQRLGERERARELAAVAALAPPRVIEVLAPAGIVDADGLDVARCGSTAIHTSSQAGGITSSWMRSRSRRRRRSARSVDVAEPAAGRGCADTRGLLPGAPGPVLPRRLLSCASDAASQ